MLLELVCFPCSGEELVHQITIDELSEEVCPGLRNVFWIRGVVGLVLLLQFLLRKAAEVASSGILEQRGDGGCQRLALSQDALVIALAQVGIGQGGYQRLYSPRPEVLGNIFETGQMQEEACKEGLEDGSCRFDGGVVLERQAILMDGSVVLVVLDLGVKFGVNENIQQSACLRRCQSLFRHGGSNQANTGTVKISSTNNPKYDDETVAMTQTCRVCHHVQANSPAKILMPDREICLFASCCALCDIGVQVLEDRHPRAEHTMLDLQHTNVKFATEDLQRFDSKVIKNRE